MLIRNYFQRMLEEHVRFFSSGEIKLEPVDVGLDVVSRPEVGFVSTSRRVAGERRAGAHQVCQTSDGRREATD